VKNLNSLIVCFITVKHLKSCGFLEASPDIIEIILLTYYVMIYQLLFKNLNILKISLDTQGHMSMVV